mgnify:CR=1 FL=1
MKRKLLITNDVGLSLDKVNSVIDIIRAEDGFEYENLDSMDETLVEVLEHLQQALDNLDSEEDEYLETEISNHLEANTWIDK